jgi:hypothetical protein
VIWGIVAILWIVTMILAGLYPLARDDKSGGDVIQLCALSCALAIIVSAVAVFTWKVV